MRLADPVPLIVALRATTRQRVSCASSSQTATSFRQPTFSPVKSWPQPSTCRDAMSQRVLCQTRKQVRDSRFCGGGVRVVVVVEAPAQVRPDQVQQLQIVRSALPAYKRSFEGSPKAAFELAMPPISQLPTSLQP